MATGTNLFTSHEARILAHTPNNTTTFLRGDNTWSNILETSLNITKDSECGIEVNNTQTTNPHAGFFGVGSSGDLGIYDRTYDKWIVYSDPSGNVSLNGNATTATSTTRLARIGDNTEGADTTVFSTNGLNVRWYSITGKIPEQPTQYGFLFTVGAGENSSENHQFWAEQSNGSIYHRGTNAASYNSPPAFKTILDSDNYTSYTVTKTGTGASGTWGINITGRAYSLKDRTNDNTSYLNYGAAGLAASAITWLCCWNGYEVRAISKAEMRNAVSSPYMVTESYPALMPTNASNNWIKVGTANSSYGLLPSQSGGAGGGHNYLGTSSWYWKYAYIDEIYSVHTRGAVWNDYAEYRKAYECEPGYAVSPSGRYTKSRLESGARIISDTYGFAIGYMENRKDMVPVAISGRVLAYPLHNKSYYKIGDAVCATKDGKIDKMTRKEIKEYPDRIIGIVNEIPDYDIWEPSREGGIAEPIHTNGRIWIDVR